MIDPTATDIISQSDYRQLMDLYRSLMIMISLAVVVTVWGVWSVFYLVTCSKRLRETRFSKIPCPKCGTVRENHNQS